MVKALYLCLCQYGHSRSVALARVFHEKKIHAIAAGWQTSGEWLKTLYEKADKICILESNYIHFVPPRLWNKVVTLDVGKDRWSNPYDKELNEILKKLVEDNKQQLGLS